MNIDYFRYVQKLFEAEYFLGSVIFLNAVLTMGFVLVFYKRNIVPIHTDSASGRYWKSAWTFLVLSVLFFLLGSFMDVAKFLSLEKFFEIQTIRQFVDLVFVVFLGMGFNMLNRRLS